MHLPDGFDSLNGQHTFPSDRLGAFARAVIHDDNARAKRVNEDAAVAYIHSVPVGLINADLADKILRTDEFLLDIPGQVAAVVESKFTVGELEGQAVGVIGIVGL